MLAESYAYYFSKNTSMKIKYFKAQIVFLLWAVASAANAEYTVGDGTIHRDSCPADCAGGSVGKLAGVARVVASVTVGNFYEDSLTVEPEIPNWDGYSFGDVCSG